MTNHEKKPCLFISKCKLCNEVIIKKYPDYNEMQENAKPMVHYCTNTEYPGDVFGYSEPAGYVLLDYRIV